MRLSRVVDTRAARDQPPPFYDFPVRVPVSRSHAPRPLFPLRCAGIQEPCSLVNRTVPCLCVGTWHTGFIHTIRSFNSRMNIYRAAPCLCVGTWHTGFIRTIRSGNSRMYTVSHLIQGNIYRVCVLCEVKCFSVCKAHVWVLYLWFRL